MRDRTAGRCASKLHVYHLKKYGGHQHFTVDSKRFITEDYMSTVCHNVTPYTFSRGRQNLIPTMFAQHRATTSFVCITTDGGGRYVQYSTNLLLVNLVKVHQYIISRGILFYHSVQFFQAYTAPIKVRQLAFTAAGYVLEAS
ncbi:hypothetical protein TNCV_473251 [Trichonephila clavipes]|nr:hypothetical protein TNCV_473251 [Trichonephila clavipes]